MLLREHQAGFRTPTNPQGLVVPINVFDGEFFPPKARDISWIDCQRFWLVGEGFSKTERYVEFQDILRSWACDVATVIHNAPEWQHTWLSDDWLRTDDQDLRPVPTRNFSFTGLE